MKMVRGHAEARWLPSRHRFALCRLYAFLRLSTAKAEPRDGLMLVVDRDQTAWEHHGIALWIGLTVTCYIAGTLFRHWRPAVALLVALPIAAAVLEILIVAGGLLTRSNGRANGILFMLLFAAASLYVARQASWVRFAAWQVFAVAALNALAAALVFLLRGPIARLERGVVSES